MKAKTIRCYRFVNDNLTSRQDNVTLWKIGKWNKIDGEIKCCKNGLHASLTPLQSLNNIYGNKWFIAEARGKIVNKDDKFAASEMRLIKEIPLEVIKRFALFCAKDCLVNYTKKYPDDNRVSKCIRVCELYLDGKATKEELLAAESAAWSARSAAESAAWSARSAAESAAWSARSAAESAARSAAWSAAESAARSAAWSAAKDRQNKELLRLIKEYTK